MERQSFRQRGNEASPPRERHKFPWAVRLLSCLIPPRFWKGGYSEARNKNFKISLSYD